MKWSASAGIPMSTSVPHARVFRLPRWLPDAVFLLPALLLFTVVVIYPVLSSLIYGFTDWNGISSDVHFVGLSNFARLFADTNVRNAFSITLLFTAVTTVLQNVFALGLALALDHLIGWLRGVATVLRVFFSHPDAAQSAGDRLPGPIYFQPDLWRAG
jgi:ABC-type sugar transport system permease subunit